MHIVAPQAESLIGEGVIALEMGATLEDVGLSVHPHPTLTEGIMDAAEAAHGKAIHILNPKPKPPVAAKFECRADRRINDAARLLDLGVRAIARCGICSTACTRRVRDGRQPDTWIVVEHLPVVTLGRQAKRENVLLIRRRAGVPRRRACRDRARRRRDVSRAGPLVVYPIRRLERFREVVPLVRSLEAAVIDVCARFGVAGERWSDTRRVGRLATKSARSALPFSAMVTLHGIALNVSTVSITTG